MSYDLATIRCEAPIEFSPEDCRVQQPDERHALPSCSPGWNSPGMIARYGLHAPQEAAEAGHVRGCLHQ